MSLVQHQRTWLPLGAGAGGPGTYVPPVPLFLCAFAGALWLDGLYRWPIQASGVIALAGLLGAVLAVTGLVLFASGLITFRNAKTGILLQRPASRVVSHGPYSWSRNPMYVGFIVSYVGGALLANTVWPLLLLPLVILVLTRFVIAREERYMSATFSEPYAEYVKRVPRWF